VDDYELIDLGGGARLERFGERLVDRPAAAVFGERRDPAAWQAADLRFDRDRGWSGPGAVAGPWPVAIHDLAIELRPTDAGQVGLFPEHAAMLPWLRAQPGARVLSLFAYTGLATLALAAAGREVTHVDASRPTVAWARHNATLAGLADRPIRWIVDDVVAYVGREGRRGRRYDGLVLDPPSYGHGPSGAAWRLEDDLASLLEACRSILAPGAFALLTAHTPGIDGDVLASLLATGLDRPVRDVATGDLSLSSSDGRALALGSFARLPGEA
jgi:23S rRNA (cytosine1962-C5)-methyltransferase